MFSGLPGPKHRRPDPVVSTKPVPAQAGSGNPSSALQRPHARTGHLRSLSLRPTPGSHAQLSTTHCRPITWPTKCAAPWFPPAFRRFARVDQGSPSCSRAPRGLTCRVGAVLFCQSRAERRRQRGFARRRSLVSDLEVDLMPALGAVRRWWPGTLGLQLAVGVGRAHPGNVRARGGLPLG